MRVGPPRPEPHHAHLNEPLAESIHGPVQTDDNVVELTVSCWAH